MNVSDGMNNILIWGSGSVYDEKLTLIRYYESKGDFHIIGITSNDSYYDSIDGYSFVKKEDIKSVKFDWILLCAKDEISVRKDIISLGIDENKVLSARVLSIPYFDFGKYISLVKSRISIFANNCWGGDDISRIRFKSSFTIF